MIGAVFFTVTAHCVPRIMIASIRSALWPCTNDFYREVFGATEVFCLDEPGDRIGHAELDSAARQRR